MERHEYEQEEIPQHVVNFLKSLHQEKVRSLIEKDERKSLNDNEMREIEPGQNVGYYNFFR